MGREKPGLRVALVQAPTVAQGWSERAGPGSDSAWLALALAPGAKLAAAAYLEPLKAMEDRLEPWSVDPQSDGNQVRSTD